MPSTSTVAKERPLDKVNQSLKPTQKVLFKEVGDKKLYLHLFEPENHKATDHAPAFVAIHGGGWTGHNAKDCYATLERMAKLGLVGISVDYRLLNVEQGTTVFDCIRDARSAVRYVREHANELGIDPDRIVVAGLSAGGHLAVGTALFDAFDHADENLKISCHPNALVLYYPVIDTSKEGYGHQKVGDEWKSISPVHQVKPNMPATILFHGTADTTCPYIGAVKFQKRMEENENQSELISFEGGIHGYYNYDLKLFDDVMKRTEKFLREQKMLE